MSVGVPFDLHVVLTDDFARRHVSAMIAMNGAVGDFSARYRGAEIALRWASREYRRTTPDSERTEAEGT